MDTFQQPLAPGTSPPGARPAEHGRAAKMAATGLDATIVVGSAQQTGAQVQVDPAEPGSTWIDLARN